MLAALVCAWSSAAMAAPRVLTPAEVRGDPTRWVPNRVTDTYPGQRVDIACRIYMPEGLNEAGQPKPPRFTDCKIVGEAAALPDIEGVATQFQRYAWPQPKLPVGDVIFKMRITE